MAHRLSREIKQRFGRKALAADASDYDPVSISRLPGSSLALFIVSTFGEGDPSDNIHDLWTWLDTARGQPLKTLQYAALGLGNSNYKYYNAVVDTVATKLNKLGATSLLPIGRADDAQGQTEEHYLDWKDAVFNLLRQHMQYQEHEPIYEPTLKVEQDLSLESAALHHGVPYVPEKSRKAGRLVSPVFSLPVRAARELFGTVSDRNCLHIEVDLQEFPGLKYKTGDHLGVWPQNSSIEVDLLLRCLGRYAARSQPLKLESLDLNTRLTVPTPTSCDALFSNYLEICSAVSRETIAALVQFAPNEHAKTTLRALSSDKTAFDELSNASYINLGRLLWHAAPREGAWKDLPLAFVVEALPAMQPRYYSIASSSVTHARQIAITAVVSDKRMAEDAVIPGLCTNHLLGLQRAHSAGLSSEIRINAHVRKSAFKLPAVQSHPIVMVAAGTGIAPFRAFIQERARLSRMGRPIGRTILFFGCRNESEDFLYKDELQEWESVPELNLTVISAFSRPVAGTKVYVQQRLQEHADEVCRLIDEKEANFYICGSAAMARDVSKVLGQELQARKGWNDDEMKSFVETQKRIRRWQQDVWG